MVVFPTAVRFVERPLDGCIVQLREPVGVGLTRLLGETGFDQCDRYGDDVVATLPRVLALVYGLDAMRPSEGVPPTLVRPGRGRVPCGDDVRTPGIIERPLLAGRAVECAGARQPHPIADGTGGGVTLRSGLKLYTQERVPGIHYSSRRARSLADRNGPFRLGLTGRNTQSRFATLPAECVDRVRLPLLRVIESARGTTAPGRSDTVSRARTSSPVAMEHRLRNTVLNPAFVMLVVRDRDAYINFSCTSCWPPITASSAPLSFPTTSSDSPTAFS